MHARDHEFKSRHFQREKKEEKEKGKGKRKKKRREGKRGEEKGNVTVGYGIIYGTSNRIGKGIWEEIQKKKRKSVAEEK